MPSDHANDAAVVAAGFIKTQTDRGASFSPAAERWQTLYMKPIVGGAGSSGGVARAVGHGATQGASETQAVAALNGWRQYRYGRDTAVNKDHNAATLTTDLS